VKGKNRLILGVVFGLLVLSIGSFSTQDAFAALDSKGTDFLIAFQTNAFEDGTQQLHITSDFVTQATVNYPVNNPTFTATVDVKPGEITVVNIPSTSQTWPLGVPANNAVAVTSPQEITIYTTNLRSTSSDAGLALPTDVFSFKYIVASYTTSFGGLDSEFVVVSSIDNTEVTITPSTTLSTGQQANVPFTITLDRGEGFAAKATTLQELSSTIIIADKPIGVTNGHDATNIPPGVTAADHIYEHAIPVQGWGTGALVADIPDRPAGSVYRIFAAEDNTQVSLDGANIANLNEAEFHEIGPLAGSHVISGDKPIFVIQYMTGVSSPGATTGDPAMANIVPTEQYLNAYTFATVGGGQFSSHFVTIIAANSDLNTIKLDNVEIGADKFTTIGSSGFSSASIFPLSEGTHTTSSTNGHEILVGGYNSADSYFYPGGAAFEFINPQPEDDRDGDGVPDVDDECPDEFAETENGCPIECTEPEQISRFFDFNDGPPDELSGVTTTEPVQGYDQDGFTGDLLRIPNGGDKNAKATLTLTDLPEHDSVDIKFLLAIIDSWDGQPPGGCCNPDIFNVFVDGVELFSDSFGRNGYDDPHDVQTGDRNQKGFNSSFADVGFNMGKDPTFLNIPHTSDTITIDWFANGAGLQEVADESWGIDDVQVSTILSTLVCEVPEPEVKKSNGGDNRWDTRPTFGISHETRQDQVVENGFSFNSEYFTLTDNHWTNFAEQSVEIGTINSFSATVWADNKLKVQEYLFGISDVGLSHLAELGVEIWYDINGEIEDVVVVQNSHVIDADTVTVSHEMTKCLPTAR